MKKSLNNKIYKLLCNYIKFLQMINLKSLSFVCNQLMIYLLAKNSKKILKISHLYTYRDEQVYHHFHPSIYNNLQKKLFVVNNNTNQCILIIAKFCYLEFTVRRNLF